MKTTKHSLSSSLEAHVSAMCPTMHATNPNHDMYQPLSIVGHSISSASQLCHNHLSSDLVDAVLRNELERSVQAMLIDILRIAPSPFLGSLSAPTSCIHASLAQRHNNITVQFSSDLSRTVPTITGARECRLYPCIKSCLCGPQPFGNLIKRLTIFQLLFLGVVKIARSSPVNPVYSYVAKDLRPLLLHQVVKRPTQSYVVIRQLCSP